MYLSWDRITLDGGSTEVFTTLHSDPKPLIPYTLAQQLSQCSRFIGSPQLQLHTIKHLYRHQEMFCKDCFQLRLEIYHYAEVRQS